MDQHVGDVHAGVALCLDFLEVFDGKSEGGCDGDCKDGGGVERGVWVFV